MRLNRSSRLTALTVVAALIGGVADATAAATGPDCCFGPTLAVSDPVPAGQIHFGTIIDGLAHVVVRRPGGTLLAGEFADGRFAAPTLIGSWPYGDPQLGDVDGHGLDDLVGADGAGNVVIAPATATGFDPPVPLARLPRAYSVLRVGDTNGDDAADIVGLDPESRAVRVLQAPGTTNAATIDAGRWPRGFTLLLTDIDGDGWVDAIGVDTGGRVHVGFNQSARFASAHADWRLPTRVSLTVADVTGDRRPDLVYRRRGTDDVYVRRAYEAVTETKTNTQITNSFHSARRWGRWDRRLPLTTAYLTGARASLVARDPRTGRIVTARSVARRP